MLAHAHVPHVGEPEGLQGVTHGLPLGVEQRGADGLVLGLAARERLDVERRRAVAEGAVRAVADGVVAGAPGGEDDGGDGSGAERAHRPG